MPVMGPYETDNDICSCRLSFRQIKIRCLMTYSAAFEDQLLSGVDARIIKQATVSWKQVIIVVWPCDVALNAWMT